MNWDTYNTRGYRPEFVYRYVSLEKLISFLETGNLYFTRMDRFEDNLENITPYDITELIGHYPHLDFLNYVDTSIMPEGEAEDMVETRNRALNKVKENLNSQKKKYVTSWALSNSESIGMWDLYAPNGFLIKFKRSDLQAIIKANLSSNYEILDPLDLVIAGIVKYQDYETIPFKEKQSLIKYSAFRKHIAFKHEDEYRVVIQKESKSRKLGLEYKLGEIDELKFELFANPRMTKFSLDKYRTIISKFTKKHNIKESKLKPWLEFKNMDIFENQK